MKVALLSDLHLEYWTGDSELHMTPESIVKSISDLNPDLVCIPGDVCDGPTEIGKRFFELLCDSVSVPIIFVPGNHCSYNQNIGKGTVDAWRKILPKQVSVLDNEVFDYDGVSFICSTLWTSLCDGSQADLIGEKSHDYRNIKDQRGKPLTPDVVMMQHAVSKKFIEEAVKLKKHCVIVTHAAPSFQSQKSVFAGQEMSCNYATDLEDMIAELKPAMWLHAHLHNKVDYFIADTRVISNSYGLPNQNPINVPILVEVGE